MHSSIARAGVQWNIPVESYLKNASDLLVYFLPWNDVNDNDDGYNFEIQLFLIQMTVQTFLNSIHDWYSDQSNVLEKDIQIWRTYFMTVCSKSMSTRSFTIFPFFSTFNWKCHHI